MSHYKYFTPKEREKILLLYEKNSESYKSKHETLFLKKQIKTGTDRIANGTFAILSVPVFCNPANQNISP